VPVLRPRPRDKKRQRVVWRELRSFALSWLSDSTHHRSAELAATAWNTRSPASKLSLERERATLRKLLDERPALNAGLAKAYMAWTGKVYAHDLAPPEPARDG
jgi:hypothetical protein